MFYFSYFFKLFENKKSKENQKNVKSTGELLYFLIFIIKIQNTKKMTYEYELALCFGRNMKSSGTGPSNISLKKI